jgi:hypothetical protein
VSPTRDGYALAAYGKESHSLGWAASQAKATGSPQLVDLARDADRHVDVLCGSNLARGAVWDQLRADGAGRSPGVASWWHCLAIGTARAGDKADNCECWPHTPHASSHHLLDAAHGEPTSSRLDTGGCRKAWRGKSEPVKRPVFQEVAVTGGPYPAAGTDVDG